DGMRKRGLRPQDIPAYIVPLSVQAIKIVRQLLEQVKPAQRYLLAHRSSEWLAKVNAADLGAECRAERGDVQGHVGFSLNVPGRARAPVCVAGRAGPVPGRRRSGR